ncbi:MAG: phosphoribosylglycinamide formyltransferase [Pseudomonadota bacterium]
MLSKNPPLSLAVLISGNGSNLQAIIDAIAAKKLNAQITCVIANRPNAYGLTRAKEHNIATHTLDHKLFTSRESFDEALSTLIDKADPDLIVLAGFMRILTKDFVLKYQGNMINIHPSLLPKYQGLNTFSRAIQNNDTFHGTSIHFVTPELDGGPVIAQSKTQIHYPEDNEASLRCRVQSLEHELLPHVLILFSENKVSLRHNAPETSIVLNGDSYYQCPLQWNPNTKTLESKPNDNTD